MNTGEQVEQRQQKGDTLHPSLTHSCRLERIRSAHQFSSDSWEWKQPGYVAAPTQLIVNQVWGQNGNNEFSFLVTQMAQKLSIFRQTSLLRIATVLVHHQNEGGRIGDGARMDIWLEEEQLAEGSSSYGILTFRPSKDT